MMSRSVSFNLPLAAFALAASGLALEARVELDCIAALNASPS
jgi:hypothetical protein